MTLVYDVTLILLCVTFFALILGSSGPRPLQARHVLRPRDAGAHRTVGRQGISGPRT